MKKNIILIICIGILFVACKSDKDKTEQNNPTESAKTSEPIAQSIPEPTEFLTPTDFTLLDKIKESATQLDIIFPGQPMSVSQNDKTSIVQSLSFYTKKPVPLPLGCPAMGRIFYVADGEPLAEVDVHFKNGCTYLIFMENEKPIHGGLMSPAGGNFFNQILAQGKTFNQGRQ